VAQTLEEMPEVICYVKNQGLGFYIPYTMNGEARDYEPDFIVRMQLAEGQLLHLILEVSGRDRKDKAAKVATARSLWIPAINNHGGFGRWAFIEITDPWNVKTLVRQFLAGQPVDGIEPLLRAG